MATPDAARYCFRETRRIVYGFSTGVALFFLADCCNDAELPEPAPEYRVEPQGGVDDPAELGSWVEGSGRVRIDGDQLVVSYTTLDGASWEVEYRRIGVVDG